MLLEHDFYLINLAIRIRQSTANIWLPIDDVLTPGQVLESGQKNNMSIRQ